jgi:Arc/MetJ-type ribon-helix-helix transcriptional regulator
MNVNLKPEQAKIVTDELKSGRFERVEEVIDEALAALRARERDPRAVPSSCAQRQAVNEMVAFVEKNRVRLEGISVKELIHEGHCR